MNPIHVVTVIGARPQFIKAAAVSRALAAYNARQPRRTVHEKIVHTGQHYDENMSQVFFDELQIPPPAHHLDVGSGGHGHQTGLMLQRLEPVLRAEKPDVVLLYGDTNSTLAGALAAAKLHLPVAHVEAGLRSFNRRMPEEINRVVADCLADLLFCPTEAAVRNLRNEGITRGVHQVGDVMYDSVLFHARQAAQTGTVLRRLGLTPRAYLLATVHRAENTDEPARLAAILSAFARLPDSVVLPLHPRTRRVLAERRGGAAPPANVRIIDPVSYLDMLALEQNARVVLTDSGGVQKEAYFFGVPCITLRDETEWVELVEIGANQVVGADADRIVQAVEAARDRTLPAATAGLYGDGNSAAKIVERIAG